MKIYAPVKDANGIYASVMFRNGVGETDEPHLIEWFKRHGYKVELEVTLPPIDIGEIQLGEIDTTPNFDSMTPNELREWMMQNGYGSKIRNTRNKEKLLEILRG